MAAGFGAVIIVVCVVSIVLCTAGVVIRLLARSKYASRQLFLEDWLVIGPAYVCIIATGCVMTAATNYGLGSHIQDVSPENMVKLLKILYSTQVPLNITITSIRISFLLFIRRLFRAVAARPIFIIITGLIPFTIIHSISGLATATLRCLPVRRLWTIDDSYLPSYCLPKAVFVTVLSIGIAIDITIFALPAMLISQLNFTSKQKIQSIVMFALGGSGCVVEGLQFYQMPKADRSPDITYNSGVICILFFTQGILGMLCSCAPAIKRFAAGFVESKSMDHTGSQYEDVHLTIGRDASSARSLNSHISI